MATTYDELVNELIAAIRADDEADSATVAAMIARLRAMNASAMDEFLTRQIIPDDGLAGGGTLDTDVHIRLAEETIASLEKADTALQQAGLATALEPYEKAAVAGAKYATKAEAKQAYVLPFSIPGSVTAEVVSPPLVIPSPAGCKITHVGIAAEAAGQVVNVNLRDGAAGSASLPAGTKSRVTAVSSTVGGAFRVAVASASASNVTVTIRVVEE